MVKKQDNRSIKTKKRPLEGTPSSASELHALLIQITKGEVDIRLGSKSRDALGKILELQGSTDLLSITSLSERIDTNPSTITRLAKNLGYSGFGEFQRALLATQLQQSGSFYSNQAQTALSNTDQPVKQRAMLLCRQNQSNIDRFIENFDTASFETAVSLIVKASRIAVYGIRQFHSFATFLTYGLRLIRSDISVLDANGLGVAEELAAMGDRDLCIVASVAPYSNQVIDVAKAAADRGISIIAITDLASSPLVANAQASIFAPHSSGFISNSITSYFAVGECLINAVASANAPVSERALREREELIKRMGIEN